MQELGVMRPAGDFSHSPGLELAGARLSWTGSECAASYRITVTDSNADTVFTHSVATLNIHKVGWHFEILFDFSRICPTAPRWLWNFKILKSAEITKLTSRQFGRT